MKNVYCIILRIMWEMELYYAEKKKIWQEIIKI